MTTLREIRVVLALCYRESTGYLIIPDCPYCYGIHKHRVPGIKPLGTRHTNASVVPYSSEMPTKISECLHGGHTYALELRAVNDIPYDKKKLCRGVKKNGEPCSKTVRKDYCVCSFHLKQQATVLAARYAELTGT